MPIWSEEQKNIIEKDLLSNALVSASAGSGKTAVMVERITNLVSGDNELKKRIPINRIMTITFTSATADELRSKIAKALKKEIQKGCDVDYFRKQLEMLPLCDISTVHSFCLNLIKNYFQELDLDPTLAIIETESAKIFFEKAVDNVLEEYEKSLDDTVFGLTNLFGGRRQLADIITKFNSFIMAQLDRDKFLNETAFLSCDEDINKIGSVQSFVFSTKNKAQIYLDRAEEFRKAFVANKMDKHLEHMAVGTSNLERLKKISLFEDLVANWRVENIPRIPTASYVKDSQTAVYEHENYKKYNSNLKDFLAETERFCGKSYSEQQEIMRTQRKTIAKLCEMEKKVEEQFNAYKMQENKLDFNDLEYYAVKLLRNEEIRKEISEKYDFVCVDEYQDINAVQEFILTNVSNGENLFMVGDTKQSIYQFRLTDPTIFLKKLGEFERDSNLGKAKSLNKNFRSSFEVLDFINIIFNKIMTKNFGGIDYLKDAQLGFGNEKYFKTEPNPIQVAIFDKAENAEEEKKLSNGEIYSVKKDARNFAPTIDKEGFFIAEKIAEMVGVADICCLDSNGNTFIRKVEYKDFCILCQTRNEKVQKILLTLQEFGIPVDGGNIVGERVNHSIGLLLDFCKIVDNFMQDIPLVNLMSSVFGGFSLDELATIRDNHSDKKFFFEAVEAELLADGVLTPKLKEFSNKLGFYRLLSNTMSVDGLMRKMLDDIEYDIYLLSKDRAQELQQIYAFLHSLLDKKYAVSLQEFLVFAKENEHFEKVVNISVSQSDCVQTNTVHKSKGLEYPIVFFVSVGSEFNFADIREKIVFDKDCGIAIDTIDETFGTFDDNVSTSLMKMEKKKQLLEEKLRLFYVALTRAINMIYITATVKLPKDSDDKNVVAPQKACSIYDWINFVREEDSSFASKYIVYPKQNAEKESFKQQKVYKFSKPDNNYKDKFSQYFGQKYPFEESVSLAVKHTVTELNELEENEDENSIEKSPIKAEDGTAYHRVLELISYDCSSVEEIDLQMRKFVDDGDLTKEQFDKVEPKIILECLQSNIFVCAKENNHIREKEFMLYAPAKDLIEGCNVEDNILLQGKVDLLIYGEKTTLVDFKFSSKSVEYIRRKYKKQIQLYSFAIEKCMNVVIDRKIIYLIGRNLTIEM